MLSTSNEECICIGARRRTVPSTMLTAIAAIAFAATANAQTFLMDNTPESTCTGTFFDSGGAAGNYASDETFVKTFTPNTPGQKIGFNFTLFSTESCCDDLAIYDGNSTAAPLIGTFAGTAGPGTVVSTAADGSLTFEFISDGSVQNPGWEATIGCITPGAGGACCLGDGSCVIANDLNDCEVTRSGTYQGDDTSCALSPCPQPGDLCDSALVVGSGTTMLSNVGNISDDPDPSCATPGSLDTWAVYTVEVDGSLLIDTCGTFLDVSNATEFDTILAAYDGACGGTELDCDDDCSGATDPGQTLCHDAPQLGSATRDSCLCIDSVTVGQQIYIQIQEYNGDSFGNITLNITPNGCPPPTGRCCQADGSCTIEGAAACGTLGGIYGGDGSDCTVSCLGACCLPSNGGCVSETEASCTNAGGSYGGDESECFTYDINTGTSNGGVICEGSCTDLTILRSSPVQAASIDMTFDNNLATQDGLSGSCGDGGALNMHNDAVFRYLAISDENGPCDVTVTVTPTGYDAVLVVRSACDGTELACSDVGISGGAESVTIPGYGPGNLFIQVGDFGTTEGGGATQLQVDCSTATGACCIGSGCDILTAGDCLLAGGTYKGANTECATSCFGACCVSNGSCSSVTEASCNSDGGSYQGDGVACTPNPCPQPPANDTCGTALEVTCGTGTLFGQTIDLAARDYSLLDDVGQSCTTFESLGPDVVYEFTPNENIEVNAGMANVVGFDASFYVVTDCLDPTGTCVAGDDSGGTEEVTFTALAGTTYFMIADSWLASAATADPAPGTSFDFFISCSVTCETCPGDVNGDTVIDGADIQQFTNCYIAEFGGTPSGACACADVNENDTIDDLDIPAFVAAVLNGGICNPGACCYLDGGSATCVVTDEAGCSMLGGDFTLGGDCTGDPCPAGRCCSNFGLTCDDIPELECIALGGDFSALLDCTNDACPIISENDTCETATIIPSLPFFANADWSTASADGPGGTCDQFAPVTTMSNDLWWEYTAAQDCTLQITVTTDSSGLFDPIIVVRDDCTNLNELLCSGEIGDNIPEVATIAVTMGTTYFIQVGDDGGSPDGTPGTISVDCLIAGSGSCCLDAGGCTLVSGGVAECDGLNGTYNGDGSDCLSVICGGACCLTNGSCVDALTGSDCEDNIGGVYQGDGTECASTSCPQPPPANDDCVNATVIVSLPFSQDDVNLPSATDDFNVFPDCLSSSCDTGMNVNNGVWYIYTPPVDCNATITATGLDGATSVWSGPDCNSLTQVACSDPPTLNISLTGGTQYWILVSNWTCTSEPTALVDFSMDCTIPPPPPANDACVDAIAVFTGANAGGNNCSASLTDDAEVSCQADSGLDVFYVWTADCTGTATVDTLGSAFTTVNDTVLTIFDACGGTEIACDDDGSGLLSIVTFPCTSGVDYVIRVAGYDTGSVIRCGEVNLNIACAP